MRVRIRNYELKIKLMGQENPPVRLKKKMTHNAGPGRESRDSCDSTASFVSVANSEGHKQNAYDEADE